MSVTVPARGGESCAFPRAPGLPLKASFFEKPDGNAAPRAKPPRARPAARAPRHTHPITLRLGTQRAKWEALAEAGRAADGRELVILYDIMSYNNRGSNKQLATFAVFELEFSSRAMIEAAKTWPMHPWPTLASSLMRCHALGCREWQPPCHRCAHAPSRWQCFGRRVTNRRARELLEQESITGHIHRPTLSHLDSDSHCVCVRVCEVSVCFICL